MCPIPRENPQSSQNYEIAPPASSWCGGRRADEYDGVKAIKIFSAALFSLHLKGKMRGMDCIRNLKKVHPLLAREIYFEG